MSVPQTEPLADFHKFVGQPLQHTQMPRMSPEEAVARWREHQETLAAIREGLEDIEAGRTRPAKEVLQELKDRYLSSL